MGQNKINMKIQMVRCDFPAGPEDMDGWRETLLRNVSMYQETITQERHVGWAVLLFVDDLGRAGAHEAAGQRGIAILSPSSMIDAGLDKEQVRDVMRGVAGDFGARAALSIAPSLCLDTTKDDDLSKVRCDGRGFAHRRDIDRMSDSRKDLRVVSFQMETELTTWWSIYSVVPDPALGLRLVHMDDTAIAGGEDWKLIPKPETFSA